jgi:Zn-dependent peptidase ImmA (M78 family)
MNRINEKHINRLARLLKLEMGTDFSIKVVEFNTDLKSNTARIALATREIQLRPNATLFDLAHEMFHAFQIKKYGVQLFHNYISKPTNYKEYMEYRNQSVEQSANAFAYIYRFITINGLI